MNSKQEYQIRELTTCEERVIYRVVTRASAQDAWMVVIPCIDYDRRQDAEWKLKTLQQVGLVAPGFSPTVAPLTPPGTVEANDELAAGLEAERERVKARAVQHGFGHRESVIATRRRRAKVEKARELWEGRDNQQQRMF